MIGRFGLRLMLFFSVVASFALAVAPAQGQTRRVLLGYSSLSSNQTPVWVAKDEGIFQKYGLDPEMILIEGGTRGAQALRVHHGVRPFILDNPGLTVLQGLAWLAALGSLLPACFTTSSCAGIRDKGRFSLTATTKLILGDLPNTGTVTE